MNHPDPNGLPERVLCRMIAMDRTYMISSAIFHKLENIMPEIFKKDSEMETPGSPEDTYDANRRLCWILYLYAKDILLHNNFELLLAFQLFLCCLDHVIRSKPSFTLRSPYDQVVQNYFINPDPNCVLKTLCKQLHINYDELCSIQVEVWEPLVQTIPMRSNLPDLSYMEQVYLESYAAKGELNEILFLEFDSVLFAEAPTTPEVKQNGVRPEVDAKKDAKKAPCNGSMPEPPPTPIRVALQTVYQLTKILESIQDGPSPSLQHFFTNCSINPTQSILDRVKGECHGQADHDKK
jgi:hypothetical protein